MAAAQLNLTPVMTRDHPFIQCLYLQSVTLNIKTKISLSFYECMSPSIYIAPLTHVPQTVI